MKSAIESTLCAQKEEQGMKLNFSRSVAIVMAVLLVSSIAVAGTLEDVRAKGYIQAGVNGDLFGFGKPDEKGVWRGLDVDTARAVAAAVFGDADKVHYTPLTAKTRFTALQSGEIDVLTRNCTQTLSRDTDLGLDFAPVNYYDGQGFLIPKKLGVKSAKQLDGAAVCVLPGTTTEQNVADYFRANNMKMRPVVIENTAELAKAFFAGRCDVLTSDASQLAGTRAVAPNPKDYAILPEIISKEPLAPAVRHGDNQWKDIVSYSVYAMINAEELGITSANVDAMLQSKDPMIQRFLGATEGNGKALGLDEKFAYNIIKQVGNYGEVFERNVGVNTPLGIERGLNALWTKGGLMYSPPFK
jgi:general L-amino acid transport system substrate-binding protein